MAAKTSYGPTGPILYTGELTYSPLEYYKIVTLSVTVLPMMALLASLHTFITPHDAPGAGGHSCSVQPGPVPAGATSGWTPGEPWGPRTSVQQHHSGPVCEATGW